VKVASGAISDYDLDLTHAFLISGGGQKPNVTRVPKVGGEELTIATSQAGARDVEVDESHLYWIAQSENAQQNILRAKKDGDHLEILAVDDTLLQGLVDDDTALFFWRWHASDNMDILTIPKTGGQVVSLVTGQHSPFCTLLVDSQNVYWKTWGADGAVYRVNKQGGQFIELAGTPYPSQPAQDLDNLYLSMGPSGGLKHVVTVAKTGGGAIVLAEEQVSPFHVLVDSEFVYWYAGGLNSKIFRTAKAGGGIPKKLVDKEYGNLDTMVIDDEKAYYIESGTEPKMSSVKFIPKAGGEPVVVASDRNNPWKLRQDGDAIYWLEGGKKGGLFRYPKQ